MIIIQKELHIFAPATIANVSCGFDVLGLCLETIGDEMIVRKSVQKGIHIVKIEGQDLPLETEKNVAGVAGLALLAALPEEIEHGFEIEIIKGIKAGSGIGSSAASSAGTVVAINHLLGQPFNPMQLIQFAMEGEKLASGTAHADNVAPAIMGGFTLVRSTHPLDVVALPAPDQLVATVIHPQIEVKTADARAVLKQTISFKKAISQWGNLGALVSGLYTEDYNLIGRSLNDEIVEPLRSILIPGFDNLKQAAMSQGALGCGISGSGPSVYALSKGSTTAKGVAEAFTEAYSSYDIPFEVYVSPINPQGVKICS